MTDDRDPGLQALFDAAPRASANSEFVSCVMADIDRQRHKTILGWIAAAVLLVPVIWWITGPVVTTLNLAAQLMPDSLIEIETNWLSQLLAPVNSVAGIAGFLFLAGWYFYRKIFS
jgi:hypothetical protein